jgi:ubiquinol-cytochrome c reductase cytochrome c1 subunit
MIKRIVILLLLCLTVAGMTIGTAQAEEGVHLDKAPIDPTDKESLRRGANYFVDYCFNCHSLAYSRYNRIAHDLDIPEKEVAKKMLFTGAKIGDTMTIALKHDDAEHFFGTAPPDLSVETRARGVDWIYTYLRSFYRDPSRPWGVNNAVFKDVAMPHVLWELQGLQEAVKEEVKDESGTKHSIITGFKLIQKGKLTPEQYNGVVRDIVNFLNYVGEPAKQKRLAVGRWVLGFLLLYFIVMWLLKKNYWRDVK